MADEKAMRVVHLASGDLYGGAESQLHQLVRQLKLRTDLNVLVVLLNEGRLAEQVRALNVPLLVLDERRMSSARIAWRLWRHFLRVRPNIVHTHRLKENVLGSVAALLTPAARSVRTAHGAGEFSAAQLTRRQRSVRFLDTLAGRLLQDAVIAVSEELSERLRAQYPAAKISVIPNGLDSEQPPRPPRPARRARRIGFVGRLLPVKRPDLFIRICQSYASRPGPRADFYLIGDGPLKPELLALARRLGVDDRVHLVGAVDDVPRWLRDLDALLMPSDHEGTPMVLLEAMALGTPVMAHAVGGIPEVLEDGACGVLLDNQEPGHWAAALKDLVLSERARKLAERARARQREKYSAEACAAAHVELYQAILAAPATSERLHPRGES